MVTSKGRWIEVKYDLFFLRIESKKKNRFGDANDFSL